MEDTFFIETNIINLANMSFFGILDGHGGSQSVSLVVKELPSLFKEKWQKETPKT